METMDVPAAGTVRPVSPARLDWLSGEVRSWVAEGLLGPTQGEEILRHYRPVRRMGLGRLLLGLGAAFVGIGVIWLVAANLDEVAPLGRFAVVTAFWLALVAAAYLLAVRRARRGLGTASPVLGSLRGLAALAFGAVVFQAAQSLQVPAYEPSLVGSWALGALLYAYAVAGTAPLLVGMVTGVTWWVWQVLDAAGSGLGVVLAFLLAGTLAAAIAVLHDRLPARVLPMGPMTVGTFVAAWRDAAALLVLIGLFAAAVPQVTAEDFAMSGTVWAGAVATALLVVAAVLLGSGTARLEPLAAAAVTVVGVLLVLWETGEVSSGEVTAGDWVQAAASIAAYVGVAGLVASLGVVRDSGRLTWLALAALVVFTTFQAFAVFSQIITGAWLFVVLGGVFAASGFGFDRARRELESSLEGASS